MEDLQAWAYLAGEKAREAQGLYTAQERADRLTAGIVRYERASTAHAEAAAQLDLHIGNVRHLVEYHGAAARLRATELLHAKAMREAALAKAVAELAAARTSLFELGRRSGG